MSASAAPAAAYAPRYLHVMLRVRDLDAMLGFYCGLLGMHEQRRIEFAAQRYSLVFIGYGTRADEPQIELWHDWDGHDPAAASRAGPRRDAGSGDRADATAARGFGHVGIGVRDIAACVHDLALRGATVVRAPAPARPGGRVFALLADPDGNEVELLAAD
jgi:lactoylglutathione lyase